MNKNVTFLFIVKNISCVQFSLCHTSDENFLTSNFSQTTVHSLYCRWQLSDLIETYKIINNQYLTNLDIIFTRASGGTTRGHTFKLFKPRVNTTIRQHFFNSRVINYWNNLPQDIVSTKLTPTFKLKLDKYWDLIRYRHNQRLMAY